MKFCPLARFFLSSGGDLFGLCNLIFPSRFRVPPPRLISLPFDLPPHSRSLTLHSSTRCFPLQALQCALVRDSSYLPRILLSTPLRFLSTASFSNFLVSFPSPFAHTPFPYPSPIKSFLVFISVFSSFSCFSVFSLPACFFQLHLPFTLPVLGLLSFFSLHIPFPLHSLLFSTPTSFSPSSSFFCFSSCLNSSVPLIHSFQVSSRTFPGPFSLRSISRSPLSLSRSVPLPSL